MIEVRGRFGFQAEALEIAGRREPAGTHHLERQHAVQAHLPGLVNNPHSALREDLDQLVIAEITDVRLSSKHR